MPKMLLTEFTGDRTMEKEYKNISVKVYYFINAIYYCLWLYDIKLQLFFDKMVDILVYPITFLVKLFVAEKYKTKYREYMDTQQKEINNFLYNKKTGLHIGKTKYLLISIWCGYSVFISLILFGFWLKFFGVPNIIVVLIMVFIPIEATFIPLNKGVFKNERYLKYFKKFEKKDKQWHKKWKRITIVFCLGCIILVLLVGLLGLQIAISGL